MSERIEDQTVAKLWEMFERTVIPPDVPSTDFTRERMREAFVSAAFTVVAILQRLDELPNGRARLKPYLEQLRAECETLCLEASATVGKGN